MKCMSPRTWTNSLNIANNLNLRFCQCDTLHFLGKEMGIWEGFPSIIGYSLVLAMNISFVPHFRGKIFAVNRDSWFSFRLWLWILGFWHWRKLYLEGLNGVTPRRGGHAMTMPVNIQRASFWIDKSRKMLASYPELCIHYISSLCASFPYSAFTMLFVSSHPHFANLIEHGAYGRKDFRISPSRAIYHIKHMVNVSFQTFLCSVPSCE